LPTLRMVYELFIYLVTVPPSSMTSDYATILNDLSWLPLSTRHKMQKLKVCYNILYVFHHPHSHFIPELHHAIHITELFLCHL